MNTPNFRHKYMRPKVILNVPAVRQDTGEPTTLQKFAYLSDSGALAVQEEGWGCSTCGCRFDFSEESACENAHSLSQPYPVVHVETGKIITDPDHGADYSLRVMDDLDRLDWSVDLTDHDELASLNVQVMDITRRHQQALADV